MIFCAMNCSLRVARQVSGRRDETSASGCVSTVSEGSRTLFFATVFSCRIFFILLTTECQKDREKLYFPLFLVSTVSEGTSEIFFIFHSHFVSQFHRARKTERRWYLFYSTKPSDIYVINMNVQNKGNGLVVLKEITSFHLKL